MGDSGRMHLSETPMALGWMTVTRVTMLMSCLTSRLLTKRCWRLRIRSRVLAIVSR